MKITLRKIWRGKEASIKDYELTQAKKDGILVLTFNGMKMTVTDFDKFTASGTFVKSKKNPGQKYQLMDIVWKPDER